MLRRHELIAAAGAGGAWNPNLATYPGVKGLWRFEPGADFLADSSENGNTLTPASGGGSEDTVVFKEGLGSVLFNETANHNCRLYISDANLSSGFPTKNGESNKSFSICFWINTWDSLVAHPFYKGNSWRVFTYPTTDATHKRMSWKIYDSGGGYSFLIHNSWMGENKWYHVGMTFDGNNGPNFAYRIRIFDYTAGTILGTDKVGTTTHNLYLYNADLSIGYQCDVNMDEVVIFDEIISTDQIDAIRQGIF